MLDCEERVRLCPAAAAAPPAALLALEEAAEIALEVDRVWPCLAPVVLAAGLRRGLLGEAGAERSPPGKVNKAAAFISPAVALTTVLSALVVKTELAMVE